MRALFALLFALLCSPAFAQVTPGTSPLTIAKGGTNAATASAARTNLGLAINTNVEAWNALLDCFSALASNGVLQRTGSGTCAALTNTQLTALVNPFTTVLPGAVPAPGSSTGKFLRDDGTFAAAAGSGTVTSVACGAGLSGGTITTTGTCAVSLSSTSVTGASTTYTSAQASFNIQRSNSGSPMSDLLPGTGPGVLAAGIVITVTNNDTAGILSIKVGSGAVLKTATASTGFVYLCPGQSGTFYSDGSNYWQTTQPVRCVFKANTTIFLSASGLATNDGLTSSTPLLDPTFAYNLAKNSFDIAGNTITFQFASGTYSKMQLLGPLVGITALRYSSNVIFLGNPSTPANVIISDPSASSPIGTGAVYLNNGAVVDFNGFQLTSTFNNTFIINGPSVAHIQNLDFHGVGGGGVHVVSTNGANFTVIGNYTISSSAGCHWIAGQGGVVDSFIPAGTGAITVTLTGTPAWGTAFACTQYPSTVTNTTPLQFSGAATGPRCSTNGGFISTGISNQYPGSSTGSNSNGGVGGATGACI